MEYIIIDGASTDGSVDLIRKRQSEIDYWRSEPDNGMYDALAKGFAMCRGDIIGWLNADDKLMPWALESVVQFMQENNAASSQFELTFF